MPPSSLYCSHRSLSMISIAARNRRMSTSPVLTLLLARATAGDPVANSPAPTVPAPTTSPVRKKVRRLVAAPARDGFRAMVSSFCVWRTATGRQNAASLHAQVIGDGQHEAVGLTTELDGMLPGGQRCQHHVEAISHHRRERPRRERPARPWPYFAGECQNVVSRE